MVSIRRNDTPQPREGARMTAAERTRLRRSRRERDNLIRRLIARGVPIWQIAEAAR